MKSETKKFSVGDKVTIEGDKMKIMNLTQHLATAEQVAAGVMDLPAEQRAALVAALTVDDLPDYNEIVRRSEAVRDIALAAGAGRYAPVLIGGAPWMMETLSHVLRRAALRPVFAFSRRESSETVQPDGSIRKMAIFRHAGFVDGWPGCGRPMPQ